MISCSIKGIPFPLRRIPNIHRNWMGVQTEKKRQQKGRSFGFAMNLFSEKVGSVSF